MIPYFFLYMVSPNAENALSILRDTSNFQWYVIPLFLIVFYIYAFEYERKNWNGIAAGLTYLLLNTLAEIGNSIFFVLTQYSPLWAAPGGTAYLFLIGLNIELIFMFSLIGLATSKFLPENKERKYFGINNRIIFAGILAGISLLIESLLNVIGALTWDYWFWSINCPLVIFGYFGFFLITFWVYDIEDLHKKRKTVLIIALITLVPLFSLIGLGLI